MNDKELLQQALKTLELIRSEGKTTVVGDAVMQALRARLAQPEHFADMRKKVCQRCGEVNPAEIHTCSPQKEPVAWLDSLDRSQPHAVTGFQYLSVSQIERGDQHKYIPVYAAPQREWVGLTDEEVDEAAKERWVAKQSFEAGAWWANEKLREKNV
jgi:hypothetical protein